MATQTKTGARPSQKAASPPKQSPKVPLKANINWMNPKEDESIRATASLTLGGAFAVHGIKVIDGQKGTFISMPSYKSGENFKDIFHAVTAEDRERMNEAVMRAYEQKLAEVQEQEQGDPGKDEEPEEAAEAPGEPAEEGQGLKM
jgi:stage V sporulation protein G